MVRSSLTRRQALARTGGVLLSVPGAFLLASCGAATSATAGVTAVPSASPKAGGTPISGTASTATGATESLSPAQATAVAAQNAPIADKPPAGVAASTPNAKAKGSLTWLVRSSLAENEGQKTVFLPAAKALLPETKIEYIVIPGADYIPKIYTMAAGGAPPDVWGFGGNYFDYWAKGLPEPLDQYINADKWDVDNYFLPGLMNIYKVKGKHYGLSQLTTFGNLGFYNKDLFEQAGVKPPPIDWADTTWNVESMLDAAHKLTKKAGQPDAVYGVDWGVSEPPNLAYLWSDDAWMPEHYTNFIAPASQLDHPGVIDAYQFRQDLLFKEHVMATGADNKAIGSLPKGLFWNQRVAMSFSGGWNFWNYNQITSFRVGVCAVPGKTSNKVTDYDDFWIMARESKVKETAWAFMRMLTNADIAADYGLLTGTPVTPRSAYDKWLPQQATKYKMTVEDLKTVTLGAIEPKRSQESTDHLFLEYPTIIKAFNDGMKGVYVDNSGSVSARMPSIKGAVDGVVRVIYDRYNGKLPTT